MREKLAQIREYLRERLESGIGGFAAERKNPKDFIPCPNECPQKQSFCNE
jgi:hypothetical protein